MNYKINITCKCGKIFEDAVFKNYYKCPFCGLTYYKKWRIEKDGYKYNFELTGEKREL